MCILYNVCNTVCHVLFLFVSLKILVFNPSAKLILLFIVFYGVMGTLSHSKIILELLLQNDKSQAFSQDYVIRQNQISHSFKYNLYHKIFFKLL